jgi:hypothetical protein
MTRSQRPAGLHSFTTLGLLPAPRPQPVPRRDPQRPTREEWMEARNQAFIAYQEPRALDKALEAFARSLGIVSPFGLPQTPSKNGVSGA